MNLVRRHGGRVAQATTGRRSGAVTMCFDTSVDDALPDVGRDLLKLFGTRSKKCAVCSRRYDRFLVSEDGPTAVEYAVMLGLIVVAIVGVVGNLAKSISGTFSTVSSTLGSS